MTNDPMERLAQWGRRSEERRGREGHGRGEQGTASSSSQEGRAGPVWRGPEVDGITSSLLQRFLTCRERFRLLVVEGLKSAEGFNHRIHYGEMWHAAEEWHARHDGKPINLVPAWREGIKRHAQYLARLHPTEVEAIGHWHMVCCVQFPLYLEHWARHPDTTDRTPLLQEQVFDVPYKLPSSRTVRLRGKWDGVELVDGAVWLREHKTKGDIDERRMQAQLTFDLQTMLYATALTTLADDTRAGATDDPLPDAATAPFAGVLYNVVRRPLSGGKGTIVRHKPTKSNPLGESQEHFYQRVGEYIREDPGHYFYRWRITVTQEDIARFRREALDPILDQLCAWWDWVEQPGDPFTSEQPVTDPQLVHFRTPYFYNPLLEGNPTDLDEYLHSGNEVGLRRVTNLFPELEGTP